MFDGIQHIGYLVDDLDIAIAWFVKAFAAQHCGGTRMQDSRIVPGGGRNAFVRFGGVEVELMQPTDTKPLPKRTLVMHHVGYIVSDMDQAAAEAKARGLKFLSDAPYTNPMGQVVFYLDPDSTNGVWMHLTKVPPQQVIVGPPGAPRIDSIIHPGYLVADVDAAAAWYVQKLGGVVAGAGPSRRGGRVAFVNCGGAQVELIEPPDRGSLGAGHVLDHVGYVTRSIEADIPGYRDRGLAFATDAPAINPIGQKLIYFETASSLGSRMHITELPA